MSKPNPIAIRPRQGSALETVWNNNERSNKAMGDIIHSWAIQLVKVDKDYRGLLRAFSKMDDIAKNDMKKIASALAERGANYAKGAASSAPYNVKQAQAVADSIKISKSDKAPSFSIGGNRKVGSSAFSAGYVIMGNGILDAKSLL